MAEYAFDVKLWTVARVTAATEKDARRILRAELDCIELGIDLAINTGRLRLSEASIEDDFDDSELVEIDGEPT